MAGPSAGGELHILDFGEPHNVAACVVSLIMRRLERTSDNIRGLLPQMMRDSGFSRVEETGCYLTVVGTLALYRGLRAI